MHPELTALGFWLRESHLRQLQRTNSQRADLVARPLGLVMHFTPANVDTMFVYSWACSLLAGNNNLVRLASQAAPVKDLLLGVLNDLFLLPEFESIARRNLFVSYPKGSQTNKDFSLQADARVIWGGDESVEAIRNLPCKPRCRDIPFADRYSAAVINGNEITPNDLDALAERLWRDIKPYQQMACSSPRVIFWHGATDCQDTLWNKMSAVAQEDTLHESRSMEHLVSAQWLQAGGNSEAGAVIGPMSVVPLVRFRPAFMDVHPGQQLCYLVPLSDLNGLDVLDGRCQTLVHWGMAVSDLVQWIESSSSPAIDRIVPLGQALEFSMVWDGMDLLNELSQLVTVR
jgi:hypothetical protein